MMNEPLLKVDNWLKFIPAPGKGCEKTSVLILWSRRSPWALFGKSGFRKHPPYWPVYLSSAAITQGGDSLSNRDKNNWLNLYQLSENRTSLYIENRMGRGNINTLVKWFTKWGLSGWRHTIGERLMPLRTPYGKIRDKGCASGWKMWSWTTAVSLINRLAPILAVKNAATPTCSILPRTNPGWASHLNKVAEEH